jgi:hypothetical protein
MNEAILNQRYLRLFNKINKLLARLHATEGEVVVAFAIGLANAAAKTGMPHEEFQNILSVSVKHFNENRSDPSN